MLVAIATEAMAARGRPVLIPAGDKSLRFACEHEAALLEHTVSVLPTLDAARTVLEKDRFDGFATRHGLPVPTSWVFDDLAAMEREASHLPYPLAVKPALSSHWHDAPFISAFGHIKMLRANTPAEFVAHVTRVMQVAPAPLVQEFVVGGDDEHFSYVSYRNRDGIELSGTLLRKLRLNPIRYGLGTCAMVVRQAAMEQIGRRVTDALPYRSVASVCFKRDVRTGEPKVFEVNGRLPLNFPAIALGGVNLPWLMYRDALGESVVPEVAMPTGGQWTTLSHDIWALRGYQKAGELTFARWLWSYRNVRQVLELDWRDPGPTFALAADTARLAFKRITGRDIQR
jgi:predicted ATP-grasp superfamily ATP-dependent carboligase